MFNTEVDASDFVRDISDAEKKHVPFAIAGALNDTMFEVRAAWQDQMQRVFDRPTPWITRSVLYRKATKDRLVAEVFINDDLFSGSSASPAQVLNPEVYGGARNQKAIEKKLFTLHSRARKYYVPGKSMPLDQYGNLPRGLYNKISSQLRAAEDVLGFEANETDKRKAARLRLERSKGGRRAKKRGGSYFILAQRRGRLRAGVIYERIVTGFGTAVRTVLYPLDSAPKYRPRFHAQKYAQEVFVARFPINFRTRMQLAVAGVRIGGSR